MESYILGLDLGTNSVGWAVVSCNEKLEPTGVHDWGAWIMADDSIEQDGRQGLVSTQRKARGEKRRQRRNLRRRRQRRDALLRLLIPAGLLPSDPAERALVLSSQHDGDKPADPYSLRAEALERKLAPVELGKVLHHLVRHRGYLSTRDLMVGKETAPPPKPAKGESEDASKTEERGMLADIRKTKDAMAAAGACTLGQYLAPIARDRGSLVRVRTAPYRVFDPVACKSTKSKELRSGGIRADRWLLLKEFVEIQKAQAPYHPSLTAEFWQEAEEAIFSQRPLSSKTRRKGHCTFHVGHVRAAKASLAFQQSRIWQTLSTLKITGPDCREGRWLTAQEMRKLACHLKRHERCRYKELLDVLELGEAYRFKGTDDDGKPIRRINEIKGNQIHAMFVKAVGDAWTNLGAKDRDHLLTEMLTIRTASAKFKRLTQHWRLSEDEADAVLNLRLPEGHGQLCAKCLKRISKAISEGPEHLTYSEALARYEKSHTLVAAEVDQPKLIPFLVRSLNNPVVERAVREAVRVIRSAVRAYDKPAIIRIEMPRDLSKSNKDREEAFKIQQENWRKRKNAEKQLEEAGLPISPRNIEKVRLLMEMDWHDAYDPDRLYEVRDLEELEIDHIIPRGISLDDSWTNRTITHKDNNLRKANKTPFQMWGDTDRWPKIQSRLAALVPSRGPSKTGISKSKVERILCEDDYVAEDFQGRALSDTRYICTETKRFLEKCGYQVEVGNGRVTAELRRRWGLDAAMPLTELEREARSKRDESAQYSLPKNRDDHRHHAIDALATALTDRKAIQRLARYFQDRQSKPASLRKEIKLPPPWPTMAEDAKARIDSAWVAIKPTRNVRGHINKDTAYKPPSAEEFDEVLRNASPEARARSRNALLAKGGVYVLGSDGLPFAQYELENNHHCVIWEREDPKKAGRLHRCLTVVSMAEALRRVRANPNTLFASEPPGPGWGQVMCLCKNDMVEWEGETVPYAVASISRYANGGMELVLRKVTQAGKDRAKEKRLQGKGKLHAILRRMESVPIIGM